MGRLKRKKKNPTSGELDESRSELDTHSKYGEAKTNLNVNKDKADVSNINPLTITAADVSVERANWYCSSGNYENGVITCHIPKIENFIQNQVEYNVDLSINGQQFSGFPMIYRFYEIKFEKIEPNISNIQGGLMMKVKNKIQFTFSFI